MSEWVLRALDTVEDMLEVEALQRLVWPGNETEIVPAHILLAAVHNGGIVIGAYPRGAFAPHIHVDRNDIIGLPETPAGVSFDLIGFVFSFPGIYLTPDGPRLKHCSHMLGVHPKARNQGVGFLLKRAQWQMVRNQGIDRITWTYDPLLGNNAHLNIARLGAICNTYLRNEYGELRDALNKGLPTDRFQVDWWVNSTRVKCRVSRRPRRALGLAHYLEAETEIINPTGIDPDGFPTPATQVLPAKSQILLVEIPQDFRELRLHNPSLALEWRLHAREVFERLFSLGYLVTDFIHLGGASPRSFYVVSHGESTL